MKLNIASMIGLLMSIILCILEFFNNKDDTSNGNEYKCISAVTAVIFVLYMIGDSLFTEGVIAFALPWLEKHFYILPLYVFVIALTSNIVARWEHKKKGFYASEKYLSDNLRYNFLGAIVVVALLLVMRVIIGDLNVLKGFYINDVLPALAPICVYMAILYQKAEQKKGRAKGLDHDPSLEHLNQKLNLFYLFNTYFLGLISVIYFVTYTIYSQIYHMTLTLNIICLVLISFALLFFYKLSQHSHRDLYLISLTTIPIILIGSVYWMSWLSQSRGVRICQWFFIVLHSITYIFLVFKREGVVTVEKISVVSKADASRKIISRIGKLRLTNKYGSLLFLPLIIILIYALIWILPNATDRLSANEAYNYIDMLCLDTDMEASSIIEQVSGQAMYDEINDSYDVEKFMKYLSEKFGMQLVEKGVIKNEEEVLTRGALENWYLNTPRHVYTN